MKKIILIFLVLNFSCNSQVKKGIKIVSRTNTICSKNSSSQKDFSKIKNWKINNDEILNIFKTSKKITPHILHYAYGNLPCEVKGVAVLNEKNINFTINSGGYFYLGNEIYGCNSPECFKYFPKEAQDNDDADVDVSNDMPLKKGKTKISDIWYGEYTFDNNNYEQSYRKFTIVISKEKCFFYEGNLPACLINCNPKIIDDKLFLSYDFNKTDRSTYDYTIIKNSLDRDLLLKISKNKNKYFINSELIKYWDEKKNKFNENVDIEAIKK